MGMDVVGLAPTAKDGEYFRASVWSWSAILDLMIELCPDLLDAKTLREMEFNNHAGPGDQATCTAIAERLERWRKEHRHGHAFDLPFRVTKVDEIIRPEEAKGRADMPPLPACRVGDEHLRQWIRFLRSCGGFMVG